MYDLKDIFKSFRSKAALPSKTCSKCLPISWQEFGAGDSHPDSAAWIREQRSKVGSLSTHVVMGNGQLVDTRVFGNSKSNHRFNNNSLNKAGDKTNTASSVTPSAASSTAAKPPPPSLHPGIPRVPFTPINGDERNDNRKPPPVEEAAATLVPPSAARSESPHVSEDQIDDLLNTIQNDSFEISLGVIFDGNAGATDTERTEAARRIRFISDDIGLARNIIGFVLMRKPSASIQDAIAAIDLCHS